MALDALAVDANVLVAAMMGGRTRDLLVRLRRAGVDLAAPEEVFREVEEHVPELAEFVRARIDQFKLAFWSLPVQRIAAGEYAVALKRAAKLIGNRDPDDIPVVALALARGICVWSNDRDLLELKGVRVVATRDVAGIFAE